MKVRFGQIYGEAGVNFPFSSSMQAWLSHRISELANPSPGFVTKYGQDYTFVIRISAHTGIADNKIKGPTVFRKASDVEYTIFLPYDIIVASEDGCRAAIAFLLNGVSEVFASAGIEASELEASRASIIEAVCSDATMLMQPWQDALPRRTG